MEPIRLQKYVTDCGLMSRRKCEEEIKKGAFLINGIPAQLGDKVTPGTDTVTYQGKPVKHATTKKHYIMLYKPSGYVTTCSDDEGRKTVMELLKDLPFRVYPVGRLDMMSEGLLLLTDDGELANRLTHPKHEIPKIYEVTLTKPVTTQVLTDLSAIDRIDGQKILPVKVKKYNEDTVQMTLFEGKNRQIRRMCDTAGLKIKYLTRVAIGDVTIGTLKSGCWRYLTEQEIRYLRGDDAC